jgi:hypothetical protein
MRNRILGLAIGMVFACLGDARMQPALSLPGSDAPKEPHATPGVTVYLQNRLAVPASVLGRAEAVATEIFAGIGVHVEWRTGNERRATGEGEITIEMQLDSGVPEALQPGALAYAMPYGTGGARIHVFCDRVLRRSSRELAGPYLGHVMAHEITHVLEGISRHSAEGVMKAHWDLHDFYKMVFRPLRFATEDVTLIQASFKSK